MGARIFAADRQLLDLIIRARLNPTMIAEIDIQRTA
jgi:hypothetical protein